MNKGTGRTALLYLIFYIAVSAMVIISVITSRVFDSAFVDFALCASVLIGTFVFAKVLLDKDDGEGGRR